MTNNPSVAIVGSGLIGCIAVAANLAQQRNESLAALAAHKKQQAAGKT